ncbi:hypothetical protein IKE71_03760 [Candidatus Saccharibacteria bacterium]|nr:hypothetical protein [Candidatus Saccharibacteria bacterium]
MEKATYRDNLELLARLYPNKAVLPVKEVEKMLGRSRESLQSCEDFPLTKLGGRYYVSVANLARWLSV